LSFDLARALRRIKPDRYRGPLIRRKRQDLPFVPDTPRPGPELLLDTSVYIDTLQGRSPRVIDDLLAVRVCNHSSVCLAELTHAFGRLDPGHPGTANALTRIRQVIEAMPAHRVRRPDEQAWGMAGIVAGLAFRLGDYASGHERRLLNDALIYLQALRDGQIVLTGNINDFDLLNQMMPEGRILLYQPA
jgi:predicted nucleic acid-binding protein